MTLTLLSLKGYRGSSVKSRALELTEGPERQGLLDARAKLLQALGALDRLAYERQKVSPLSADAKCAILDVSDHNGTKKHMPNALNTRGKNDAEEASEVGCAIALIVGGS